MRLGLIFITWLFSTGISSIFDVLLVYLDIYNSFISLIFYIFTLVFVYILFYFLLYVLNFKEAIQNELK